ncbi:MAG TPA: sigma-70 family RNA polymerase sigma factor, partial [Tepidisphaeraceae bacterium]
MNAVSDQNDLSLLQEFSRHRSQDAFAELTGRHLDWVYSAALRRVGDRHLAEDVTQAVFLLMAQNAHRLSPPLNGWLFKVTCYASANIRRAKARREKYERRAAMQKTEIQEPQSSSMWDEISPTLDTLIGRLRARDRDALLLRFYQRKTVAEVAAALGISEDAAKLRIRRALERLRNMFRWKGIPIPSATLATAMISSTTQAAPADIFITHSIASASASSTTIVKSVALRLAAYKLKLIAAMLLISALVPAGFMAGKMLWNSTPAAQSMQSVQAAALEAPPSNPEPAQPTVIPAGTETDEQALAPFLTPHTDVIYALNPASIDFDAIDKARSSILQKLGGPWLKWDKEYLDRAGRAQAFSPRVTPIYKKHFDELHEAGVERLYFLSQSAGGDGAVHGAAVIIPITPSTKTDDVLKIFADLPIKPQIIRNSVVFGAPDLVENLKTASPAPRPDLLAALQSVHGNLRRVVAIPMVRRATPLGNHKGLNADVRQSKYFRNPIWNNVLWFAEGINSPPNEAG